MLKICQRPGIAQILQNIWGLHETVCLQFSTLLQTGLLHDMLCLYNTEQRQFHTLVTLGPNVCGHPRITHGGEHFCNLSSSYNCTHLMMADARRLNFSQE